MLRFFSSPLAQLDVCKENNSIFKLTKKKKRCKIYAKKFKGGKY